MYLNRDLAKVAPHPEFGKLMSYIGPEPINKIKSHGFFFIKDRTDKYIVVAITDTPVVPKNSRGVRKKIDLFRHEPYENYITVLEGILITNGHKGYAVWSDKEGYRKYIEKENNKAALDMQIVAFANEEEPQDLLFLVKPYKDFELLKELYSKRLYLRMKKLQKDAPNPAQMDERTEELEMIEEVVTEVKNDLANGLHPYSQIRMPANLWNHKLMIALSHSERNIAHQFLNWLEKRKKEELITIEGKINPEPNIKEKTNAGQAVSEIGPENNANHFCQSMPLSKVKEHFKVFTEKNSKNNKPFLTTEQLNLFLEKAFHGKATVEKQAFNYAKREKLFIVKRFYQFYLIAVRDYESISQCQPKYIKLLTDNFINWEYKSVKNNFGNKVKRDW